MKRAMLLAMRVLPAVMLACAWTSVAAQEEDGDNVAVMWHMKVKPGHSEDFETAVKDFHEMLADKEGAWTWHWYSVLTGPETGTYIARSGGHDWADLDVEHDWEDEVDAYFEANVAPHIDNATRSLDMDFGIESWPEDSNQFNYFMLEEWYIRNGHYGAFRSMLGEIHDNLQEGGFKEYYYFASTVAGGKGNEVTLVLPHKNWADMAEPEPSFMEVMTEQLGEDNAGQMMADFGATYKTGYSHILKWRKDMNPTNDYE